RGRESELERERRGRGAFLDRGAFGSSSYTSHRRSTSGSESVHLCMRARVCVVCGVVWRVCEREREREVWVTVPRNSVSRQPARRLGSRSFKSNAQTAAVLNPRYRQHTALRSPLRSAVDEGRLICFSRAFHVLPAFAGHHLRRCSVCARGSVALQ
ncbi:hypothetical protein AAFF_G00168130, partial [Aldrovandia affinis]